ncbi:DoxX family protein [Oleiharenicola lentus]|uniref:DoxX family protein n=1 Tax=Oleiharenicola lentus TaxID=2508720 RepID=UPI003F663F75
MNPEIPTPSKGARVTGYILTGLVGIALIGSGVMKIIAQKDDPKLLENLAHIGMTVDLIPKIGVLELICAVIYLIPRTAVLGAVLLTGYMGGAILTHVRVGDPFHTQIIIGVVVWAGIYLREPRLRAVLPLRK